MNYGWRFVTLYRIREQDYPQGNKKTKKAKWLSEEALQIAVQRRQVKSKGEKERYTHLNAEIRKPFQHCTAPLIHKVKSLSSVQLLVTLWTVAHQAPLSMGFSRQEYWSGLPFPSPGDLLDPGIEPMSPAYSTFADTFMFWATRENAVS